MRFKIRTALIGGAIYLYLLGILAVLSTELLAIFVLYAGACMAIARSFILGAESRKNSRVFEFSQSGAADSIGTQYGSFHHVFYSNDSVIEVYRQALGNALKGKLGGSEIHEIVFKDVDRDLPTPESRTFLLTSSGETVRKSGFFLLCHFTRSSNIQGVRWWVLVSGLRDPNKVFWRYAFAPLSVPFVIFPYSRRQYDPLNGLTTIYPGFFNGISGLQQLIP